MMRRGAVGRRGPGLLGTMARTAVIAGTATAVSKGVSGSMDQRAAQQQAAQQAAQQQQQQAAFDAGFQQAQAQQQQQAAQQAGAPQAAGPATNTDTMISQLQQLAELQNLGILTPDEFTQQKARILGGAS